MSRSRKFLLLTVALTFILSFSSIYITGALYDRVMMTSEDEGIEEHSENPGEGLIDLFPVNDENVGAILGYNHGFKGTTDVKFVKAVNLSMQNVFDEPELLVFNSTSYSINIDDYINATYPVGKAVMPSDQPVVLIIHTHGTEAYLSEEKEYYTPSETFRSTDTSKNIVAVGEVMAKKLNELGVPTLHDNRMHDLDSYNRSYLNSYRAVKEYLELYPSIRYVIDVHRDSIFTEQNENQKPVTIINGEKTAQVMLVVGTNQSGGHVNWRENMTVAVALQARFNNYQTLSRPIYVRTGNFNQQLTPGMMLLEVGSCGNTLEEANRAVELTAKCLAELIKSK